MAAVPTLPQLADLEIIAANLLGVAGRLLGLTAFIFLLVGGFQLLTASGDPKKAEQAGKTITNSLIGLAFIIGAWFLLNLLQDLTGVRLTRLRLKFLP